MIKTLQPDQEMTIPMIAAIVQSSDDAIICTTTKGVINYWNAGAEKVFGYSAKEVMGKNVKMLNPAKTEDPRGVIEKFNSGGRIEHFESKRIKKMVMSLMSQ